MERSGRRFGLEWFYRFTAGAGRGLDGVRAWLWQYGRHIVTLLIAAVLLITLGPGIWRFLRMSLRVRRIKRGQGSLADATLLYHRMLHLLRRRGFEKRPSHTPGEFAASLPRTELRALVEQFTAAYHQVRFGGRLEAAPQLSTLLERIEHRER
jgi:hypothetical protein